MSQKTEQKLCPACGKLVVPEIWRETVRRGVIMSFYRMSQRCPKKNCGERL